jgi:prepilin-type N-terminal cleavage/methylation domain-containing protein
MRTYREEGGFTLIELLIVVAIIGLLAAIGVWNYLIALDRGKQKRTIVDIRTIATAWEQRAGDTQSYNASGAAFTFPASEVSFAEMTGAIAPTYIRTIPKQDGWGNDLQFGLDVPFAGVARGSVYAIRSAGRDGAFQATYESAATTSFDCDIVYSNSSFVVYPERETRE